MMRYVILLSVMIVGAAAFLILRGPSAPEHVVLDPVEDVTLTRLIYAYDPQRDTVDGNIMCSEAGLVPLEREMPERAATITDVMNELLKGDLAAEETALGYTTEFPLAGFRLLSAETAAPTTTLTFEDPLSSSGGGSCRVSIIRAQIEATALQFPGTGSVVILPEEILQP